MITHILSFTDEAAAKAALPDYWLTTDDGWSWRRDVVDGPIPTTHKTGNMITDPDTGEQVPERVLDETYNLNIARPTFDPDMPGLISARDETGTELTGNTPHTPQRVFA